MFSESDLLSEAQSVCGSLPANQSLKHALPDPNSSPSCDFPKSAAKAKVKRTATKATPASPSQTPKKAKTDTSQTPQSNEKEARNTTSLISARCSTAEKNRPRTYIQGRIEEGGAMFLVCEMTEKKNSNHKEDMEKVAYACVRFSLCCCCSCT